MEKGLNFFSSLLNGSIFDNIPLRNASATKAATNSDGDPFPDWQVYDFGTVEDDGYGGIVKIYDDGSVLRYVFENFQTPSESWTGWLTSPDTDQFPAGAYGWEWTVQTSQGTKHWKGDVTVSQQGEEQFFIYGTLQLADSSGNYHLTISETNPLTVDALQPALLVGGQSDFSFTDANGISYHGVWRVTGVGTSQLWVDKNGNGEKDNGETVNINYDPSRSMWQVGTIQ